MNLAVYIGILIGLLLYGWYFSHPASNYFTLGRIDEDQAVDYARRKGWSEKEMVKWLGVVMK